jgi:hypothetical protein
MNLKKCIRNMDDLLAFSKFLVQVILTLVLSMASLWMLTHGAGNSQWPSATMALVVGYWFGVAKQPNDPPKT